MNKVFLISGSPAAGKDTFINLCKTYDENILNFSSVDYIKWLSHKYLDIDTKKKTPELRKFLSEFKRILTEFNDYPFQQCVKAIETLEEEQSIFIHVREKSEMDKIKKLFPQTKIVYVEGLESVVYGNFSDDNVKDIEADIIIHNNSTLQELSKTAKWFVKTYVQG